MYNGRELITMRAVRHPEEQRRLQALREYGVLDAPDDARLSAIVLLTSKLCEVPVAFINVIDGERQCFLAEVGLGVRELPRDPGVCNYAILQNDIFEVPDAELDPRFSDIPQLTGPDGMHFYAGAPLRTPEGLPLGTLCIMDREPRRLTELHRAALQGLADQIMAFLDLQMEVRRLERGYAIESRVDPVLQAEAEFVRIVTDRLPVRVGYLDHRYRYVFLNGGYERMFGFAPREAWGRPAEEIVGATAWATALPFVDRAMAGETNVQEFTAEYPFGPVRVEAGFVPDFGPEGAVRGVVVYGVDVTARYEAQQALVRERKALEETLETAEVATWRWEISGDRTFASRRLQFFFGLSDDDANGGPLAHYLSAIHFDDRSRVAKAISASQAKGERYEVEYRVRGADGQDRWVLARGSAELGPDGMALALSGVLVDITGRKQHEEALRRSEERLRNLSEQLETRVEERTKELQDAIREAEGFNYSVAHDLRAPLRAIISTARILSEDLGQNIEESYRELLERQAYNASRLGRLIDELLRLSRLSRVAVNREAIDMSAKSRSVAEELDPLRHVEIQPDMVAEGDRALVRTVLQNLIGNAFKFSPSTSTISVGQTDGTFWVRDKGIGFDMQYAPKLFLPFERLVTEQQFEGTGIGLANVDRIVRRHGGRVWAEGNPGHGATFFFTLA